MSDCYRTIGLVLLLFACGSDAALDLGSEAERDHKSLQTSALRFVIVMDRPSVRRALTPHMGANANGATISARAAHQQSSESPFALGTLLSHGCLLSV
jgi:hypothetical protein